MATSSLPRTPGIYLITCTANGRVYVGSSYNIRRRWIEHRRDLRGNYHPNRHLQRAWNKYGEPAFTCVELEACERNDLLAREQAWIDELRPFRHRGFNIAIDARASGTGLSASPETRAKLSAAMLGKKKSSEHCAAISAGRKGVIFSPETRAKIGATSRGRKRPSESQARINEANSKRYIVTSPDGTVIAIKNLTLFCRNAGLDAATMSSVATGKRKGHKGWTCRYAEEPK